MVTHAPPGDLLADYASGASTPGEALLVAAHLAHAPDSRQSVAEMESVGAALMAETPPAGLSATALETTLSRIDALGAMPEPAEPEPLDQGPLPRVVIEAVGRNFDEIPWRFVLPGISEYRFEGYDGERVSLLRARPGRGVPKHTHEGREMTVILAGAMKDGETVFGPGDVSVCDESHDHHPTIVGDEICYCLIVMDGGLRFTGTFGRALNMLAE